LRGGRKEGGGQMRKREGNGKRKIKNLKDSEATQWRNGRALTRRGEKAVKRTGNSRHLERMDEKLVKWALSPEGRTNKKRPGKRKNVGGPPIRQGQKKRKGPESERPQKKRGQTTIFRRKESTGGTGRHAGWGVMLRLSGGPIKQQTTKKKIK